MIPCLSQATTLASSFEDDVDAYARAGWTAIEIWLTKLEQSLPRLSVAEAARRLADDGLRPLAAASQGGLLLPPGPSRSEAIALFRSRLDLLQALGVPTLVVTPDFERAPGESEVAAAVEGLAEAAEMAREAGVRLALEFPKQSRFCASLDTASALVEAAGGPKAGLGVCLDAFHFATGPSKTEDLDDLDSATIIHVQVSDLAATPRELAGDGDRVLPGDGDFRLDRLLDRLEALGYDGPVSVEVPNPALRAIPVDRVADVALRALLRVMGRRAGMSPSPGPRGREGA